jgi:DNA-binding winged helix-turn-helix (wHTH) protein
MIQIGHLHVSLIARSIRVGDQPVRLGSRAFDILILLIHARGELVTLAQITNAIWPQTVVVENNIRVHITAIRKLLGDDRGLLITDPGRGYRLVLPEIGDDPMHPAHNAFVQSTDSTGASSSAFSYGPAGAEWASAANSS